MSTAWAPNSDLTFWYNSSTWGGRQKLKHDQTSWRELTGCQIPAIFFDEDRNKVGKEPNVSLTNLLFCIVDQCNVLFLQPWLGHNIDHRSAFTESKMSKCTHNQLKLLETLLHATQLTQYFYCWFIHGAMKPRMMNCCLIMLRQRV